MNNTTTRISTSDWYETYKCFQLHTRWFSHGEWVCIVTDELGYVCATEWAKLDRDAMYAGRRAVDKLLEDRKQ